MRSAPGRAALSAPALPTISTLIYDYQYPYFRGPRSRRLHFDKLVIAVGSSTNTFGTRGVEVLCL
jgi:NADH dehydrogenase FAD-containing subunit